MSKKGESSKKEGSVGNNWKAKSSIAKAIVKRKFINKKTQTSTFSKF